MHVYVSHSLKLPALSQPTLRCVGLDGGGGELLGAQRARDARHGRVFGAARGVTLDV